VDEGPPDTVIGEQGVFIAADQLNLPLFRHQCLGCLFPCIGLAAFCVMFWHPEHVASEARIRPVLLPLHCFEALGLVYSYGPLVFLRSSSRLCCLCVENIL
jgi:hypothetical protein